MDTIHEKNEGQEVRRPRWLKELVEWALVLVTAVVVAMLVRTLVFEPFYVDGPSMQPTLQDRELMFTTKYDYILGAPERFDVVICRFPERDGTFVKRLVGLPGDEVAVADGILYINGEACEEPYVDNPPRYTYGPHTLGEDEYFVLGDNRAISNDSHLIGPLRRDQIVSHVRAIIFPFSKIRGIE